MMTKIAKLKQYTGKQFTRTILDDNVIENLEAMRTELQGMAKENDISFEETEDTFVLDGQRVFTKPKRYRETTGTVVFRSKDYYFNDAINGKCYGDLPKAGDIDGSSFVLRGFDGEALILYQLVN